MHTIVVSCLDFNKLMTAMVFAYVCVMILKTKNKNWKMSLLSEPVIDWENIYTRCKIETADLYSSGGVQW